MHDIICLIFLYTLNSQQYYGQELILHPVQRTGDPQRGVDHLDYDHLCPNVQMLDQCHPQMPVFDQ